MHLCIVKMENILFLWLALAFLLGDSSFCLEESIESCLRYKRDSEYTSIKATESLAVYTRKWK